MKSKPVDLHTKQLRALDRKLAAEADARKGLVKRWKQAEQELVAAEQKLELFQATAGQIEPRQYPRKALRSRGEAAAIIVATDWHAEQRVDSQTVNGVNEFNLNIAERRIAKLRERAVYLTENARGISKINSCVLAILGDMITGYIHDELVESNFLSPAKAILFVQQHLAELIEYLLKHGGFQWIDIPCCVGNHGRTTQKMRIATRTDNSFESIVYHNLAQHFAKEKRVRFHVAEGYHLYLDVCGWRCRMHHGDAIKYHGGVGGISIPVNKAIAQWNKTKWADYDFFGHWHQFLWHKRWVACPSLMGYDTFSQWIKADYEDPSQAFGVIDRRRGLVEMRPLFVEAPRSDVERIAA